MKQFVRDNSSFQLKKVIARFSKYMYVQTCTVDNVQV